jgi:hypothetical protein
MEIVPPYVNPVLNNVVTPVRMEMIAKENAKFDITLQSTHTDAQQNKGSLVNRSRNLREESLE